VPFKEGSFAVEEQGAVPRQLPQQRTRRQEQWQQKHQPQQQEQQQQQQQQQQEASRSSSQALTEGTRSAPPEASAAEDEVASLDTGERKGRYRGEGVSWAGPKTKGTTSCMRQR
jgi:transcription initiation factor TFIID subunit TAF12